MSTNKILSLIMASIGLMGGFLISSVTLGKETGRTLQRIETHSREINRLNEQDQRISDTISSQFASLHGRIDSMTKEIVDTRIEVAKLQAMIEGLQEN